MNSTKTTISVIIADDHTFFREGFKLALKTKKEINLIAEASNGEELCTLVERLKPDVVITDISMPIKNGIEATKHIRKKHINIGIIGFSATDELQIVKEMFQAGAQSFIMKDASLEEMILAIKAASKGKLYLSNIASTYLNSILQNNVTISDLNKREIEIIKLLYQELTSKQIGDKLCLSERTIEDYRKRIQKKIGAKNIVGILKYAHRNKIVEFWG